MSLCHRHSHDPLNATMLGACGYLQFFLDALAAQDAQARSSGSHAALILLSIDNLAMIMSGYSMAVA